MTDNTSRQMLNELTRKTFGFDFDGWVNGGYFEGDYIPYSFVENGKMLSNVSANRMHFTQKGVEKHYIQIGTVMTDESHRKQGLAAKLMEYVIGEYEDQCDGIYLFGNMNACGFYEKIGFRTMNQYRYFVKDEYCRSSSGKRFMPVKNMGDDVKNRYLELVRKSYPVSSLEQINKFGLQVFYTAGLDNVSYAEDIDCFIVTDQDDCTVLQSVLSNKKIPLADVIGRLTIKNNKLRLGFVPLEEDIPLCTSEVFDGGEDYRLFYRGAQLEAIERDRLYFPDLSHA
jgi:GNAT superfamily N-acetyltransferase